MGVDILDILSPHWPFTFSDETAPVTVPARRLPTAVNQPPCSGGTDYPFISPSSDITLLLSDFYLSFRDDAYATPTPLHVGWLYGFGPNSVAPPAGWPTPTHDYDLVVLDADDQVVFDSTQAAVFQQRDWGSNYRVLEWHHVAAVCRCVIYLGDPPPQVYDNYIVPDDGRLDARTYEILPRGVRTLHAAVGNLTLMEGYNLTYRLSPLRGEDGGRLVNTITINAVPGSGLGRQPASPLPAVLVRTINEIGPDANGNFLLDADGCYRGQFTVTVNGDVTPRQAAYGSDSATAAWQVNNDCQACCPGQAYVNVYQALKKLWDDWTVLAAQAEAVRDQYAANRERWLTSLTCREDNPLRLIQLPEGGCAVQVGAVVGNLSVCCWSAAELRFTLQVYDGSTPVSPGGVTAIPAKVYSAALRSQDLLGITPYVMQGAFPIFKAEFANIDPQTSIAAQFRLKVPGCTGSYSVVVTVTLHAPDPEPGADSVTCTLPTATVPGAISAIWSGAGDVPADPARFIGTETISLG